MIWIRNELTLPLNASSRHIFKMIFEKKLSYSVISNYLSYSTNLYTKGGRVHAISQNELIMININTLKKKSNNESFPRDVTADV